MRTILTVLAFFLATAALASAASTNVWDDEAGDETLAFVRADPRVFGIHTEDCHNKAADVRSIALTTTPDVIELRLTMAGLSDLKSDCSVYDIDGTQGRYRVSWQEVTDEVITSGTSGVTGFASTTGFGVEGCLEIMHSDSSYGDSCMGTAVREGASIVWTIPIVGVDTVSVCNEPASCLTTHEESRPYDFRGFTGEVSGTASVAIQSQSLIIAVGEYRDFAAGGVATG